MITPKEKQGIQRGENGSHPQNSQILKQSKVEQLLREINEQYFHGKGHIGQKLSVKENRGGSSGEPSSRTYESILSLTTQEKDREIGLQATAQTIVTARENSSSSLVLNALVGETSVACVVLRERSPMGITAEPEWKNPKRVSSAIHNVFAGLNLKPPQPSQPEKSIATFDPRDSRPNYGFFGRWPPHAF